MPGSPVFDALTARAFGPLPPLDPPTRAQRYLYRLQDGGTHEYARPTLITSAYPVIRETAKCYVISWAGAERDKFVLKDPGGRRFAYLDLADAQNSYRVRKIRQIERLSARHDRALEYLAEIRRQMAGEPPESESLFFVPVPRS